MPVNTVAKSKDAASKSTGAHMGIGMDTDDSRVYINRDGVREPVASDDVALVTASATLTGADDGKTIIADSTTSVVMTLPATALGMKFTLVVGQLTTSGGHAFSPNASDKIMGNGFTAADDKDAICTADTDRVGDSITLVGDGSLGWYITAVTGTWARE